MALLRRKSEKIDVLRKVPLFGGLSNKHLDLIARSVDEVSVPSGHAIARQDRLAREAFIMLDGTARVERDGRLIAKLKPGDCFGEMSLLDGQPRSATVIAESDVSLLVVDPRAFLGLVDTMPALARRLLATLSERLRNADIQLASRN